MKYLILLGAICSTQAAIFEFDFAGGGMNGANVRPTPILTTATGGEIVGFPDPIPGISYDDQTHGLYLNFAWGDQNGFTDLVGNFLTAEIRGPADENGDAQRLYNLTQLVNPNTANGHDGGVFGHVITLTDNPNNRGYDIPTQEQQLLSGQWFITVGSSFAGPDEIRGQLVPLPEPQTYGLMAGIALAGFATIRKFKKSTQE